jgi:hypothetical protein
MDYVQAIGITTPIERTSISRYDNVTLGPADFEKE